MAAGRRLASGVTLAEVLVASALLGVALVPAFDMVTRGLVLARDVQTRSTAAFLAEREMEDALAKAARNFSLNVAKSSQPLGDGYLVTVTQTVGSRRKTVHVEVGHDADASGALSAGEVLVALSTLVGDTATPGGLN